MRFFVDNKELLEQFKKNAREKALNEYTWVKRKDELNRIFDSVVRMDNMPLEQLKAESKEKYKKRIKKNINRIKMDVRNLFTLDL